MYHRVRDAEADQLSVTVARFAEQMRLLSQERRVISLASAIEELSTGVTEPGVAVTFDDGYTDNLIHALPVLERFRIPATIFVVSGFCDGRLQHRRYPDESGLHLNWQQVGELDAHPLIEIGSHTITHPLLSTLNAADATREIGGSRAELQAALGHPVRYFCYPSGDFSLRDEQLVESSGYEAAVSVSPGRNRSAAEKWRLHRTEVTDRDGATDFGLKLDGAYDLPHAVLDWKRRRAFRILRVSRDS